MATVYRRGDSWYYYFRWNGRRYRGACGDATLRGSEITKKILEKSDAEQFLAKRMREVQKADIYDPKPEAVQFPTFAAFADEWLEKDSPEKKSKQRDRDIVAMLKVEWQDRNLDQITAEMIDGFKAKRTKHRAPATVAREVQTIKRLFKKAVEWGRIPVSPALTVKKPRVKNDRERHLESNELETLMEKIPAWLHPIVTFALFTGARRGEILDLTWNDVDLKRGLITFRETKNGEDGRIVMNETVKALLKDLPEPISRSQRIFQTENTPAVWVKINRAWNDACRAARIGQACGCSAATEDGKPERKCRACKGTGIDPDFHFHDLRHQAATELLTLGATLNDVRDFLRHKTTAMTLRYAHLVEDRRRDTARLLDRLAGPGAVSPKTATGKEPRP